MVCGDPVVCDDPMSFGDPMAHGLATTCGGPIAHATLGDAVVATKAALLGRMLRAAGAGGTNVHLIPSSAKPILAAGGQ